MNSTLRQGVRAGRQGDFLQTTDVRFPGKHTAMGWEVVPAGLSEGVVRLHKATQAGAPLRDYFAWSPMDNFECQFAFVGVLPRLFEDLSSVPRLWLDLTPSTLKGSSGFHVVDKANDCLEAKSRYPSRSPFVSIIGETASATNLVYNTPKESRRCLTSNLSKSAITEH